MTPEPYIHNIMSEIFKVQKNSKRVLWQALLVAICIIFVVSFYYFKTHSTFLKYSNETFYTPLDSKGIGFTGNVNELLETALLDTNANIGFDIKDLNNGFYNRLRFYSPLEDSNYLVSIDDIRLVNIIPANRDEAIFLKNSYLKDALEKQGKFWNRQIFRIFFDRKHKFRIKSITIDPSLYKAKLCKSGWEGEIKFLDPFRNIDENSAFIVFPDAFFPLFCSTEVMDYNTRDPYKVWFLNGIFYTFYSSPTNNSTFSLTKDLMNCYSNMSIKNQALLLILSEERKMNSEPPSLRIKNLSDHLELTFNDIDSGRIYFASGDDIAITNNIAISILNIDLPVKITYLLKNKHSDFTITKVSPLTMGSKSQNVFESDERMDISNIYTDLFTKQLISGLENSLTQKDSIKSLELSINPLLSKYLEDEMKLYIDTIRVTISDPAFSGDVYEISICLVDNKTGEILAAPFYSTEFKSTSSNELTERKNFNFIKHFIGSTFKPLISNAATIKFPSLSSFRLTVPSPGTSVNIANNDCSVLGFPVYPIPFGYDKKTNLLKSSFWTANDIDRIQFLNQSHDMYPVALSMLALTEPDDAAYNVLTNNTLINPNRTFNNLYHINQDARTQRLQITTNQHHTTKIENFKNSSFCYLISQLYDIELDNVFDRELQSFEKAYDTSYFNSSFYHNNFKSDLLLPEMVSLNVDILGSDNLLGNNTRNFNDFSTWVLGQGLNELSNLKLAEAYARLFTKRNVTLSFWHKNIPNNNLYTPIANSVSFNDARIDLSSTEINDSWSVFLDDFYSAQQPANVLGWNNNLLPPVVQNLTIAENNLRTYYGINLDRLSITGKTGTPEEFGRVEPKKLVFLGDTMYYDEGLYAFGLMNHITYNSLENVSGISGVIYIRHISRNSNLAKPNEDGVKSKDARNFLSVYRLENIIFLTKNEYEL